MIRRTLRIRVLGALLLLLGLPLAGQVLDAVRQVSQPNYTHYLSDLLYTHAGDSRGPASPQHDAARANIRNTLASFGLQTAEEAFSYQGGAYFNVTALLPGKLRPAEYHVVGAHYDSVNNAGADDDASGVAALLETARVASLHDFEASIVFVAFDREEAGLIGSKAWAAAHGSDKILGMVQMDMISFNPQGTTYNTVALCPPDTAANPALSAMQSAVAQYSGGLTPVYGGISTGSDHASFARLAPAVEVIEGSFPGFRGNTNYHKPSDSIDTPQYIDYAYASGITRSTVGYLAAQAGLLPESDSTARFSTAGIANSASYIYGPAAASELITLSGTGFDAHPTVTVRDSAGQEQPSTVTYASPRQVNLVLPERLAAGPATVTVTRSDGVRVSAGMQVDTVAPGVFTAESSGLGAAAAQTVRVAPDGGQAVQDLFACVAPAVACGAVPVNFGDEPDRVVLVLYGTGIRGRSSLAAVTARIAGETLPVQYAGAQPSYAGLDQVNVELPRSLRGKGKAMLALEVDGKSANPVAIDLGQ